MKIEKTICDLCKQEINDIIYRGKYKIDPPVVMNAALGGVIEINDLCHSCHIKMYNFIRGMIKNVQSE